MMKEAKRLRTWANGVNRDSDVASDVRAVLDHLDRLTVVADAARETESALNDVEFTAEDSGAFERAERAVGVLILALVALDGDGS